MQAICSKLVARVSLPARGAWIEINWLGYKWQGGLSRSPHGERQPVKKGRKERPFLI